ncbi:MAG: hypothetical protein PHQ32_02365 [Firmicutes bacterium]|nr:hypothetical protein [Bacillota bacterium]
MCERLEKACKDLVFLKETMEVNNEAIKGDIKIIKDDIKGLVLDNYNTRTDVLLLQGSVDGIKTSLDKLIEKHDEQEESEVATLKKKLNEKDEKIDTRKWQIKLAVFVAILSFISFLINAYIS